MKLYYATGTCSLSPHIVLREAGANFTLIQVKLATKKTDQDEDFTAINPKGYVPVLELDNGEFLTEGPAIVQYIADQFPKAGLAPAPGTLERARLQEWLTFIGTELHKSFGPLFRSQNEEWRQASITNLERRFDFTARHLTNRLYLLGEHFSVADAYLFTVLRWTKPVKIDLARWPALCAYRDRIAERPAVHEALSAEGLS